MQTRWVPVPQAERRRVQSWLDTHLIADWLGNASHAERVEAAMRTQFSSLRITNDPLIGGRGAGTGPASPSTPGVLA